MTHFRRVTCVNGVGHNHDFTFAAMTETLLQSIHIVFLLSGSDSNLQHYLFHICNSLICLLKHYSFSDLSRDVSPVRLNLES